MGLRKYSPLLAYGLEEFVSVPDRNKLASLPVQDVVMFSNTDNWYLRDVVNNLLYLWNSTLEVWVNVETNLSLPQSVETIEWITGSPKPEFNANYVIGDFNEGSNHQVTTIPLNSKIIKRIVII